MPKYSRYLSLSQLSNILDKPSYMPYSDYYGVIGDAYYCPGDKGWWNYRDTGKSNGEIPRTLSQLVIHLSEPTRVIDYFYKYPLNLIICEYYGSPLAIPMVRFYQHLGEISRDEDSLSNSDDYISPFRKRSTVVDPYFHGFWLDRCGDIGSSTLQYLDELELLPYERFSELDPYHRRSRLVDKNSVKEGRCIIS